MHAQVGLPLPFSTALLLIIPILGLHDVSSAQDDGCSPHFQTVLEGVKWRESMIGNMGGQLVHARWMDGTANEKDAMLYTVRFLLANGRSRFSATCLKSGTNPWEIQPNVRGPFFELPGIEAQTQVDWPRSEVVRDGMRELVYASWLGQGYIRPQARAYDAIKWAPFCNYLLLGNSGATASELMATGLEGGQCEYVGTENVLGLRAHVVVAHVPDRDDEWICRFWVCEERGWAVVQTEHCLRSAATGRVTQVDLWTGREFRELHDGIWLPTESEGHKLLYQATGTLPLVSTELVSFRGLTVNRELSQDSFVYAFPPGTLVMDNVTGEVTGEFGLHGGHVLRQFSDAARPKAPERYNVPEYALAAGAGQ